MNTLIPPYVTIFYTVKTGDTLMPYTKTDWKAVRRGRLGKNAKKRVGYSLAGHVAGKPKKLTPEQIAKLYP
jgi:hypothetical protein